MNNYRDLKQKLTIFMNKTATFVGRPAVFLASVLLVVGWFVVSRFLPYDVWFDIMDVTIFITTFFMLFIVQASQNADTEAIQDKLDDIIEALPKAHTSKEGEEKRLKRGKGKR